MTQQQSTLITWKPAKELKPHPLSVKIYGNDGYEDLKDSIRQLGILQALYINKNNTIVSGHRRWQAALAIDENYLVPTVEANFSGSLDEHEAIIEYNRYRIKNGEQLANEALELKGIYATRAETERKKAGQLYGKGHPKLLQNFAEAIETPDERLTRTKIARSIGLGSGEQLRKLEHIQKKRPDLLSAIKPGGRSISSIYKDIKRTEREDELSRKPPKQLTGKYNVILADPPWQYDSRSSAIRGVADDNFPTMSIEALKDENQVPVKNIVLEDVVLFLWTTGPMLRKAFELIDAWGFEYKTSMVWVKDKIGTGFYVRSQHELVLIATKGTFRPMTTNLPPSVFYAPTQAHTRKPDILYEIIEKMYPKQRYVELFATKTREGWDAWGNEV